MTIKNFNLSKICLKEIIKNNRFIYGDTGSMLYMHTSIEFLLNSEKTDIEFMFCIKPHTLDIIIRVYDKPNNQYTNVLLETSVPNTTSLYKCAYLKHSKYHKDW